MTSKTKLESYVEAQFGTDLYGFIKQKAQVDGLYDYEIASLLKASDSMITKLRNAYGIKRVNGFSRRFDRKYGKGSVERFKKMVENPDSTLAETGRYFGFTKEYARQVYKRLYGSAYTEAFKRKRLVKKKKKGLTGRKNRSKQFGDLTEVSKKMKSMGLAEEPILAQIMTTREVAEYLKLHEITIINHAAKGIIPGIKIGSRWRFDKQAIDKWISGGQKKAPQKSKKISTSVTDSKIIKKSRKGIRSTALKKKSEIKDDNPRPVIYKLRKKGETKSQRKGTYKKT